MLNESQERYVSARLQHVEELLSEALDQLADAEAGAVFVRLVPDATPLQRKILHDHLEQVRFAIRRFMKAQALHEVLPPISALRSFQTATTFALIAVEELGPKYLRGYGELEASASMAMEQFVAELTTLLNRIGSYLASGKGGDLASRLAQLDATRDEIALLRALERVISAYGLVEFRATLEDLIGRATTPRLEIAVFGRVNTGKSSLLNWWLGAPILPIGITPVTAVTTRISYGTHAEAYVTTSGARSSRIPIEELPAYTTEQGNPRNSKSVLEVTIRIPSERLAAGITLVDTPGLGSLAVAGAIQTLQYLPRCDLGIVLLEGGAPFAPEDLGVARALLDGGSEVLVALSKADRLSASDLSAALIYVQSELQRELSMAVPVSAISTVGASADLAARWFNEWVEPRLTHSLEEAAKSLKRKIGVLREAVIAVLEVQLHSAPARSGSRDTSGTKGLAEQLARVRASIDRMRRDIPLLAGEVRAHLDAILLEGARALERSWRAHNEPIATAARVQAAMAQRARKTGERVVGVLDALRAELQVVADASGASGTDEPLSAPRGLPVGEFSWAVGGKGLHRPCGVLDFEPVLGLFARRRVQRELQAAVGKQLGLYGEALRLWAQKYLDELTVQFDAIVARSEGVDRLGERANASSDDLDSLAREIERLRQWP